ncbi:hypothetical protein GGX14DRAFT_564590 [Mycena pura]|uniref:Uncharacterized protein n=1 Tax=Mycena pura TaxID=153505 RepID=A0AAD6YBL7_9AGAR|nr:hypothetical protein GGX14DRAFT_564590 [Mycena pura]
MSSTRDMPNPDGEQPQNHTLGELTQTTMSSTPIPNDMPNLVRNHKKLTKEITDSVKDDPHLLQLPPGSRVFEYKGRKIYVVRRSPIWRKARREQNRLVERGL